MLMDDLRLYGQGDRELDRRVRNKCAADLVYYSILQECIRDYGIATAKNIADIDADALCIARNQMAQLASDHDPLRSDHDLLRFDPDGRVTGFYNPDTKRYDRELTDASRRHFVRESFLNCEAVRAMVSTSLASSPAYRGLSMSDEEFEAAVEDHIQNKLLDEDDPDSPLMRVVRTAGSFDTVMGGGTPESDYFAMDMPEERVVSDQADAEAVMARDAGLRQRGLSAYPGRNAVQPGSKIMALDDAGRPRPVRGLKLSPLMPELRILRETGLGEHLGLYKDQRGHAMSPGQGTDRNNSVLMYDAQKRLLCLSPDPSKGYYADYLSRNASDDRLASAGILFGPSRYMSEQAFEVEREVYLESGDGDGDSLELGSGPVSRTRTRTPLYDNATQNYSLRSVHAWTLAWTLENISQRRLNDSDYDTIKKIAGADGRVATTIFGDVGSDGEAAVAANAAAYFGYIGHVCRDVRKHMPTHEFAIHFDEQQSKFADKSGFLPLLYMTGEHTDDHNRARSNPSQYFAFYPYADYTPANMDVSPLMGDIAPAAYNTYTITDQAHRRGLDPDLNDPEKNRFAHAGKIDADAVRRMRGLYDDYMAAGQRGSLRSGVRLAKIRRRVGDTGLDDLARFIRPDGSVDGRLLMRTLVDDMNVIKSVKKQEFLSPSNRTHMSRVFDRFAAGNGGETGELGDALALFYDRSQAGTGAEFGGALSEELYKCLDAELGEAYLDDVNSYMAMRHIYRSYLSEFSAMCVDGAVRSAGASSVRDRLPPLSEMPSAFGNRDHAAMRDRILERMSDGKDPLLDRALKDLYGEGEYERDGTVDPDVPQKIILKADRCRYASQQFLSQDYNDLLTLLSYTGQAAYEPNPAKPPSEVMAALDASRPMAIQLYAAGAYGPDEAADYEAAEDGLDDSGNDDDNYTFDPEVRSWFDATFSDPDDGKRTLAWLDADYSGEAKAFLDGEDWRSDPRADHAVYEASHPLQCEALRRCGRALARTERGFDPERLSISRQGVVTYESPDGTSMPLRIGPFTDEEAYIRPIVVDDPDGTPARLSVIGPDGFPERDAQGTVLVREATVTAKEGYYIGADGKLENPVEFGALDRRSALPPDEQAEAVNNRFYGLSAAIEPHDGYDHRNRSYIDRMSVSSYQMLVLENLDRALAMHALARNSDGRDGTARSLFYTNTGPASLSRCYRTRTFILDDKAKCGVAGKLLRGCADPSMGWYDMYPAGSLDGPDADQVCDAAERVSGLVLAQARTNRSRVVAQTIETNQNIGLYNQSVNLHQCEARDGGQLDVKSMLDTDSKGARVAMFQYNPVLDSVVSGTAKKLGQVGFFTDAVDYDRITGELKIDPEVAREIEAGGRPKCRMPWISQGIGDVFTGSLVNLAPHSGGQAFDRQQLSSVGGIKSVNYAPSMKFAMIGLGFDMEDGYISSDRAVMKLGHFMKDGTYAAQVVHDKIGDAESGNKGVTSHIETRAIGAGMSDADAESEFMARYLYDYLHAEGVNHGGRDEHGRMGAFWAGVRKYADKYFGNGQPVDLETAFKDAICSGGCTVGNKLDELKSLTAGKKGGSGRNADKAAVVREEIYQGLKPYLADMGRDLLADDTPGFASAYKIRHAVWQVFRDNPDLDIAMTNVCVCTRSNPSLLMNIGEACDRDREALEAARAAAGPGFDEDAWLMEHGESVLVMRDADGNKVPVMGACGTMPVYVDSHTAEDKNRDYNKREGGLRPAKAGRRLSAQEIFALQAERCCTDLFEFMSANDPMMPDNVAKANRKTMMNGFVFDVTSESLPCRRLSEHLDGKVLAPDEGSGGLVSRTDALPGIGFVDMAAMARVLAKQVPASASQDDVGKAVEAMREGDFSKLLNLGAGGRDGQGKPKDIDNKLRNMFAASFGRDGGAFMILPAGLDGADASADIGILKDVQMYDELTNRTYRAKVPDRIEYVCNTVRPDGTPAKASPLFLSSKEITNPDSDVPTVRTDDRAQFRMFKTVLAMAVADELHGRDLIPAGPGHDRVPALSDEAYEVAADDLKAAFSRGYARMPKEKSLSLDGMNGWAKKNLYYFTMKDSMTSVWSGDPTLAIDEIGMSFESAKSMGLLKLKEGLDKDALAAVPDTFEFMRERYEPMSDDDMVVVNRSPGQTTGCVRAFHPKIVCADGGGIRTNPACATIFDGDYDGDTVGVSDPLHPEALRGDERYAPMAAAAKKEFMTRMSMQGNMVHEADYRDVVTDKGNTVRNVHPLFIAGNADYGTAKYNMSRKDADGVPACGYDVSRELDACTCMANMLYELRNCAYDRMNAAEGRIMASGADRIVAARQDQISALDGFFVDMDGSAGTEKDREYAVEWAGIRGTFAEIRDGFASEGMGDHKGTLDSIAKAEKRVFERFRDVYSEMAGYIASEPLMTQGRTQHEILHNVIRDANISRKGKAPQLSALLSFSSTGTACGGRLSVGKDADGKFELRTDGAYSGAFDPGIRMSHFGAVSDVPMSPFRTQVESHTVAQADKSDATGMGGAMAQKMQKIFAPAGYGGFGLRNSGPITQSYLDAKQNVTKCGNNLKIGKFVLDGISRFSGFDEFSDGKMSGADKAQVFRGQYTKSYKASGGGYLRDGNGKLAPEPLTAGECVAQLDNFIQVMGHPGFTDIDKAVAGAVLSAYEDEDKSKTKSADKAPGRLVVKNPVQTADRTGDMTYAIMYGRDDGFAQHLAFMAENEKGLFDGSFGFEGRVDLARPSGRPAEGQSGLTMGSIEALAPEAKTDTVGLPDMGPAGARALIREKRQSVREALASVEAAQEKPPAPTGCEGKYAEMMKNDPRKQDAPAAKQSEDQQGFTDDVFG